MKVIAIVILANLPLFELTGQVNLQEIKNLTRDSSARYFYDTLVADFLERPHEFEMTKGICLYYGKLYSKYYKPYNFSESEANFEELVRRGNYQRAITVAESILEKDPVNLMVLLKLLKCYFETKEEALAEYTRTKIQILHKAILHSGHGDKESSPHKVIAIADEYAVMGLMNVEPVNRTSQVKQASVVDHWKVRPVVKGPKRDLYFELLVNKETLPDFDN